MSTQEPQADKNQIGLSAAAATDLDYLEEHLDLVNRVDAYRLAASIALSKALLPAEASVSRTTAYSASGTVDPDGHLRAAVLALRDDHGDRPYALIERLVETGLRDFCEHLERGLPLREYLATLKPKVASADHP